jgi:hypothetical protein
MFFKNQNYKKIHTGQDDSCSGSLSLSGSFIPWYIHHPMIRIMGTPTGMANPE